MGIQLGIQLKQKYKDKINWLPVNGQFKQCIISTTFNIFNSKSPVYMGVFKQADNPNTNTIVYFSKLSQTSQKSNQGQNTLFYLAPNI